MTEYSRLLSISVQKSPWVQALEKFDSVHGFGRPIGSCRNDMYGLNDWSTR